MVCRPSRTDTPSFDITTYHGSYSRLGFLYSEDISTQKPTRYARSLLPAVCVCVCMCVCVCVCVGLWDTPTVHRTDRR